MSFYALLLFVVYQTLYVRDSSVYNLKTISYVLDMFILMCNIGEYV